MRALLVCLALLAAPAAAQNRDGNDTPGDWRVKHYESFGIWTSVCDEREESGSLVQRCYIRWVDVFSPHPKFAAQFLFITPQDGGWQADFGIEPGTLFTPGGFRIQQNGKTTWRSRAPGCLTGLSCSFTGERAAELIARMQAGGAFRFTFRDRHGMAQDLTWPLAGFAEAFADFQTQAAARSLLE